LKTPGPDFADAVAMIRILLCSTVAAQEMTKLQKDAFAAIKIPQGLQI